MKGGTLYSGDCNLNTRLFWWLKKEARMGPVQILHSLAASAGGQGSMEQKETLPSPQSHCCSFPRGPGTACSSPALCMGGHDLMLGRGTEGGRRESKKLLFISAPAALGARSGGSRPHPETCCYCPPCGDPGPQPCTGIWPSAAHLGPPTNMNLPAPETNYCSSWGKGHADSKSSEPRATLPQRKGPVWGPA